MIPVTLLYAGILILLSVLLANQVLYVRLKGDKEPEWRANAVLRVQANFVENVPLALVLLYLLEIHSIMKVHFLEELLLIYILQIRQH